MKPDESEDRPNLDDVIEPPDLDDVIEAPDLEPGDFADPCPAPSDLDGPPRGYAIEIFGDERGGQTPTRPEKKTDDF